MAILNFEGFDDWPLLTGAALTAEVWKRGYLEYVGNTSVNTAVISGGRFGTGRHLRLNDGTAIPVVTPNATARSDIAFGAAIRFELGTGTMTVTGQDTAAAVLTLTLSATANTYSVSFNPAGTANDITVTSVAIPAGINIKSWCYLEVRSSPSVFEFAINGTVIYTKVFTANANMSNWRFVSGSNTYVSFDDLYVSDTATFLGERVVNTLTPTSTAEVTGFLVGAATAHEALASDDGDTSYVWFSANDQKVLVDVSNLATTPTTIDAVRIRRVGRKTGTVAVSERLIAKTATENFPETAVTNVGPDYFYRQAIMQTDPADATAWTKAKVDGLQIGIKRGS